MTSEQIRLIQQSWASVAPVADSAAALFYGRLFELDPSLRPMFSRSSVAEQGKKLMQTLAVVVAGLEKLDGLLPAVEALGRRHAAYGVRDEHYATVAAALLWTLERGLGEGFTPAVRGAWTEAYGILAGAMQRAASAPESQAA